MSATIAVVRVRGRTHVRKGIADTMKLIGLTRKNYCTIILDKKQQNMVHKAKDYLTWGEVTEKTIMTLLKERGRVTGNKKLTDSYVKENSKFQDIKSYASALSKGEVTLKDVKGIKVVFRLNPPRKGFERRGIKAPFSVGGALGNRGDKINDLLERMK